MKLLVIILSIFISILLLMNTLPLLNKGSIIIPIIGIIGVYLIIYINIKTNFFTKFNFKKQKK